MAKFSLIPFNHIGAPAIDLTCELNANPTSLFISYKMTGNLASIDLGDEDPKHARVIKLWEKSCFELFIKNQNDSYIEFNFSPEFEWNAFFFEKKGDALKEFVKIDKLKIDILLSKDVFQLIVEIDKGKFPTGFFEGQEHLAGITSVIKDKSGSLSYWALSHEDTRPNFHDFRSFKYKF